MLKQSTHVIAVAFLYDALNMPENLENAAVATGLENVRFHSNPKEVQCQRMFKLLQNCPHFTS